MSGHFNTERTLALKPFDDVRELFESFPPIVVAQLVQIDPNG